MKPITEKELFTLYIDTMEKCGIYLLDEDDQTIEYNVLEEFEIGVHSFLHLESLKKLYNAGLIGDDKMKKSLLLRENFIQLRNSEEWSLEHFKTSDSWKEILVLADEVKSIK